MSDEVSNSQIYGVLLGIKEDIGGLKSSTALHLEGLKNHGERIGKLENVAAKQKGAVKVWGLVATASAALVSAIAPAAIKKFLGH